MSIGKFNHLLEAKTAMKICCPKCHSTHVTDGSSRLITVLGIIVLGIGLFVLFGLCCPHQIEDWSHYIALEEHDWRALFAIILGIILLVGGSTHPDTLYCEVCGCKWERASRPKVQLRAADGHHKH
jgi:hypothetical protein